VVSLSEIGCHEDIPETGDTLEENAVMKARYIWDKYQLPCFADDTGLEVEALNGAPGVRSARYADEGPGHDSEANMRKLLRELGENNNRNARFRTVIALIGLNGDVKPRLFEGIVNGQIALEKHGTEGFGYDPLFVPEGYDKSFAELGLDIKNSISHRHRAVEQLVRALRVC
jgi:XTP/dITP diphosphohydrolase